MWEVHSSGDEDVDFTFGPEVVSTIPKDAVGRSRIPWEFEVEVSWVGIEDEVFEVLG